MGLALTIQSHIESDVREIFYKRFWTPCYTGIPDSEWPRSCWFPELQSRCAVIFYESLIASAFACHVGFMPHGQRPWFAAWLLRLAVGGDAAEDACSKWLPAFLTRSEEERDALMADVIASYLPINRAAPSLIESLLAAVRQGTEDWVLKVLGPESCPANDGVPSARHSAFALTRATATELARRDGIARFDLRRTAQTESERSFLRDARDYLWAYFTGLNETLGHLPFQSFQTEIMALSPPSYLDLLATLHSDFLASVFIGTYNNGVHGEAEWFALLMDGLCEMYNKPYSYRNRWLVCMHQHVERRGPSTRSSALFLDILREWLGEAYPGRLVDGGKWCGGFTGVLCSELSHALGAQVIAPLDSLFKTIEIAAGKRMRDLYDSQEWRRTLGACFSCT